MSRERTTSRTESRWPLADEPPRDDPDTFRNAVIGAIATIVTAPLLPFAAIFGGGVAGYLQRSDLGDGAKVGAITGALAAVPAFFVAWLVVGFLLLGGDPFLAVTSVFALVIFLAVAGYLVGAGAFGGALGAYVRREL
jgi:nitric oxide reductase large subunit